MRVFVEEYKGCRIVTDGTSFGIESAFDAWNRFPYASLEAARGMVDTIRVLLANPEKLQEMAKSARKSLVDSIIQVQPMTAPVGEVFYIDYVQKAAEEPKKKDCPHGFGKPAGCVCDCK